MTRSANRKAMDVSAAAYGQALRDGADYATAMQAAADAIGADLGHDAPATPGTCPDCGEPAGRTDGGWDHADYRDGAKCRSRMLLREAGRNGPRIAPAPERKSLEG